jgi:hypothetical protein
MRWYVQVIAIVADVVMGSILGVFLFAVIKDQWPGLDHPALAALVITASIALVLFHRRRHRVLRAEGAGNSVKIRDRPER